MSGDERASRMQNEDEPDSSAGGKQTEAGRACGGERMRINFDCRSGCRSRFEGSLRPRDGMYRR
jgi:hypothetical protein